MSVQNMEKDTRVPSSPYPESAGSLQKNTVNGLVNVCLQKQNGKKRRGELTEIFIPGEMKKLTVQEPSLWTDREEKAVLLKS